MMLTQDQIKKMHNGLQKCPMDQIHLWMPEIMPVIETAPVQNGYVADVKVHMLMPNQFPCIPNWHGDAIPRDADGNLLMDECDDNLTMYLWLSGPPITEFKVGREVKPCTWIPFKQRDIHRGVMSEDFQWRVFIRLMPNELVVRPRSGEKCLRRHSQVYLNANNFTW